MFIPCYFMLYGIFITYRIQHDIKLNIIYDWTLGSKFMKTRKRLNPRFEFDFWLFTFIFLWEVYVVIRSETKPIAKIITYGTIGWQRVQVFVQHALSNTHFLGFRRFNQASKQYFYESVIIMYLPAICVWIMFFESMTIF